MEPFFSETFLALMQRTRSDNIVLLLHRVLLQSQDEDSTDFIAHAGHGLDVLLPV